MSAHLISNARLLDPATGRDEIGWIRIKDGLISEIGTNLPNALRGEQTIDAGGRCVAPGLIDLRVKTGEPGEEHRETIATATAAAAVGGITTMVLMPDTRPVIDDVALVKYLRSPRAPGKGRSPIRIEVAGALTVGLKGEAMAEIGLMKEAGAAFFSNGDEPVANPVVMKRAMAYGGSLGVLVASRPDSRELRGRGVMTSGAFANKLGLPGIPKEAETIGAARDILLAEATGCPLLLDLVSAPRTLDLIADAKARGIDVRATTAAHLLYFNDQDVGDYLTYCKVNPPFRAETDRRVLVDAVKAGVVDAVVSAHDPQPPEVKRLPIAEAAFGAAGLETSLASMLSLVHGGHLSMLEALAPLTSAPADILGCPQGRLAPGAPADLVVFDPDAHWKCDRERLRSRSTNSPYDGRLLQGLVIQTMVDGQIAYDRDSDTASR